MKYDVVIIGAGIIGSLIADKLAKYDLQTAVIEKNCDSGLEQTMSSSAIVHSGIDPKDGTNKAKYNVLGNKMMKSTCEELNVDYLQCGGYICSTSDKDLEYLKQMEQKGKERNIECNIISGDELRTLNPKASSKIKYALSMPTTGVIYPTDITIASLERAIYNETKVFYETKVTNITYKDNQYLIETNKLNIIADYIINCAGINSDEIARYVDVNFPIKTKAKRGEYFVTSNRSNVVNSVLYPIPNANGKGVLVVPTTHGNTLIGPNGVMQESKTDDSTHTNDLAYVQTNCTQVIDEFPQDIIKTYAGLRATGNDGDFYINECLVTSNMFNLVAIDSPGIAASPAIAEEVVNWLLEKTSASFKSNYKSSRDRYIKLSEYSLDEQNDLIKNDKSFGKIICRCEQVSEGEIRAAIRKQNGARNITGLKYRVRPMLGMCQGSFCEAEVVKIMADELGVKTSQITRVGEGTVIIKGEYDETI